MTTPYSRGRYRVSAVTVILVSVISRPVALAACSTVLRIRSSTVEDHQIEEELRLDVDRGVQPALLGSDLHRSFADSDPRRRTVCRLAWQPTPETARSLIRYYQSNEKYTTTGARGSRTTRPIPALTGLGETAPRAAQVYLAQVPSTSSRPIRIMVRIIAHDR